MHRAALMGRWNVRRDRPAKSLIEEKDDGREETNCLTCCTPSLITFDDVSMKLFIHDLLELFSPLIDEGRKLLTPPPPPGAAEATGGGGGTGAEVEFIGSFELKRKVSGSFSRTSFPTARSSRFSTNVLIVGRCRGSTCSNVPESRSSRVE